MYRVLVLTALLMGLPTTSVSATEGASNINVSDASTECVVLLHGLARTAIAMEPLADKLMENGYLVANIDYPSRKHSIQDLVDYSVVPGIQQCEQQQADTIHFVTHSLGGVIFRQYLQENEIAQLGRVVMLGPPNKGSEIVDHLKQAPGFEWFHGPAGMQLGTDISGLTQSLNPVDFELGVIAGSRTINPVLSQMLANPDDGKVTVASTKVEGMCSHLTLPLSHAFLMRNKHAMEQIVSFLDSGAFNDTEAEEFECVRHTYS